jgi:hypothetical protein
MIGGRAPLPSNRTEAATKAGLEHQCAWRFDTPSSRRVGGDVVPPWNPVGAAVGSWLSGAFRFLVPLVELAGLAPGAQPDFAGSSCGDWRRLADVPQEQFEAARPKLSRPGIIYFRHDRASRRIFCAGRRGGTALAGARQSRLERRLAPQFPKGTTNFKEISERRAQIEKEYAVASETRAKELYRKIEELNQLISQLLYRFSFEEKYDRFLMLRCRIFGTAVVMVLGFGIFAWAANPGKDGGATLADPYLFTLMPRADDLPRLRSKLTDACLQSALQILVLREHASGNLEGVTLGPTCPPTRVVVRDKGTSIALQR